MVTVQGERRNRALKTIFITSFHGLVSRILEGGIIKQLLESGGMRIVLFVPDFKVDYFKERFGVYPDVVIEGVSNAVLPPQAWIFHRLSFMLLNTRTMRLIRRSYRGYRGAFHKFLFAQALAVGIGRWKWGRWLFWKANYLLSGKPVYKEFFKKYKPDLVFSTDGKLPLEAQLLIEARKFAVPAVVMVRSWDYLTAKGLMRVKPDVMLVHNEIIKKEAETYVDMNPEHIVVVGMPHFDLYVNTQRSPRDDFLRALGIGTSKRVIMFAPMGNKFGNTDSEICEILDEAIHGGRLPNDLAVLVRIPPGDDITRSPGLCTEHLIFDYAGERFERQARKANEMSLRDLERLADSLFHSELLISVISTMCIDAAAFDKPIIFLGFTGREKRHPLDSWVHAYGFNHISNVLNTGGAPIAHTSSELISYINHYLAHPESEREGRRQIVEEQCGILDGNASRRVAAALLSLL